MLENPYICLMKINAGGCANVHSASTNFKILYHEKKNSFMEVDAAVPLLLHASFFFSLPQGYRPRTIRQRKSDCHNQWRTAD